MSIIFAANPLRDNSRTAESGDRGAAIMAAKARGKNFAYAPPIVGVRSSPGALLLYVTLSLLFFGRGVGHFTLTHIARGSDPSIFIWCLAWWPYAIVNHLNPFLTKVIWVPSGFNVAWSTSIPLQSIMAWPITRIWGPAAAFNTLALLLPPLSAWSAFLLCRYIVRQSWIALLGGYIYGFSAFILGAQSTGHLHLTAALFIPLFVYLILVHFDGGITRGKFVTLMTLLFVLQFLSSLELFATVCFACALALAAALIIFPDRRSTLYRLCRLSILSLALALGLLTPYVYFIFAGGAAGPRLWHGAAFSADLANSVIPPSLCFLGGVTPLGHASDEFLQRTLENGAGYVGLPLILVAAFFTRQYWHDARGKLLVVLAVTFYLLSLGPRLHVAGTTLFGLPWKIFEHLPLLDNAMPVRLSVYLFLILALMTVIWLSSAQLDQWTKILSGLVIILFLLPNASVGYWTAGRLIPSFFTDGLLYTRYLKPHEVVMPMPSGIGGQCMLWQAMTGMYFRMAGGYTVPEPAEYASWPIMQAFAYGISIPEAGTQLKAFMANHDVSVVIRE